jgi:hypothetical protein
LHDESRIDEGRYLVVVEGTAAISGLLGVGAVMSGSVVACDSTRRRNQAPGVSGLLI